MVELPLTNCPPAWIEGIILAKRSFSLTAQDDIVDAYLYSDYAQEALARKFVSDFEDYWNRGVLQERRIPYWKRPDSAALTLCHNMTQAREIYRQFNKMTMVELNGKLYYVDGFSNGNAEIAERKVVFVRDNRVFYSVTDGPHRFKIECMFRELKQQIHSFNYHFWSSHVPKLNKYKKKSDPDPLSIVREEHQESILLTIDAIERFVLCSEIAMGLVQLIALTPIFANTIGKHHYLRTFREGKVSEATIIEYLRKHFFRLLSLNDHSYISQLILSRQEPDLSEDNVS